ncbi:RNA polymerase subunit RPABC4/transcription elongation factor Spt4 [Cytobacillus horneckiae]|uniref:hypothetical protein n=1 Tax=Cytobacillus horneckiae TaxID=549687 RepID=UPI000AA386AE|nr:hypothetical protein [Cytobacillus horneckiae]MBN6888490.1 hypothetical protein [Cytobacillus horneckiae]MCM3180284.1 hypothetical protein [Cytobacillus horneckiae]MEC1156468.1 hypothetical protein [Cytobacillus horneckiae]MED2938485.1 hypothetical protein [Cytobacillus horneckiae]
MEKFYCDHCKMLYNEEGVCQKCGTAAGKKIIIKVQRQEKNVSDSNWKRFSNE